MGWRSPSRRFADGAPPHNARRNCTIAEQFLAELGCPLRQEYQPSHLAEYVGGSARSWQRWCERGEIEASRNAEGDWIITRDALVRYVAERCNRSVKII
jgi:hypothetical protein